MTLQRQEILDIQCALSRTWDCIGGDILQCQTDAGMKAECTKDEVIETCLDASYLEQYGSLSENTLKEFKALTYDEKIAIAKKAFIYTSYGY